MMLGSDDPLIKGLILSHVCSNWIWYLAESFQCCMVRKKMVDQVKLKRIMKETKAWQKERMAAMRAKDQAKMS